MNSRYRVNGSRTVEPRQHHNTQEHGPSNASRLKELLDAFLTKPQDRALFNLEPKESSQ